MFNSWYLNNSLKHKDAILPRRARLAIAGVPWHIIQRGNNRSACFYREEDYLFYLEQLNSQASKFGCALHAYCLMTNHVHLLVTPSEQDSASLMMKNLGQRFVQFINKTYQRSGTLWEGRFKSCITQEDNYVLACYRYIELNPVRAGIVALPENYRWSSFGVNGEGDSSDLITPHEMYLGLASTPNKRLSAYRKLFSAQIDEQEVNDIRAATNGNFVLGNQRFQRMIGNLLQRRTEPGKPGRPRSQLN